MAEDSRYRHAHTRVRRERGPAREYLCVDCGDGAEHWSFSCYEDVPCRTATGRPFSMNTIRS